MLVVENKKKKKKEGGGGVEGSKCIYSNEIDSGFLGEKRGGGGGEVARGVEIF